MIVMKFGGTSVEGAPSMERVAEIIRLRLELKPIVVVSAMGKTTRRLLEAAEASAAGAANTSLPIIVDLKSSHTREAQRLIHRRNGREVFRLIEQYFDELTKLLQGLAILGEVPPRGLDKILAYGELLSSAILADALSERSIPARLLDARELIKTDDDYGRASPIFELTTRRIREIVLPIVETGMVPVVQGFIGSTREGATTTLGFEGSDYTAAILGAALDAHDIQIWKDVSGLMTADPAVIPGAHTVKFCSFAEAAELTYFGAKVLHPKAIGPAARKNIPIHIYNSKQPTATGTAITAKVPQCSNPIKSIAYKRSVRIIRATGDFIGVRSSAGAPATLLTQILSAVRSYGAAPLITALSSSSVALAIDTHALTESSVRDLTQQISLVADVTVENHRAIVTLVGEGVRSDSMTVGRLLRAIDRVGIGILFHGVSPIMINFVVAESDVVNVVAILHETCFEQLDPNIFE